MAVVGIAREKRGSPSSLRETSTGFSVTRTFIVETSDHKDGPIVADQAVGLPQRGHRYAATNESHFYLFCMERSLRRINDRSRFWHVECEYRTPDPNNKDEQKNEQTDPVFELPIISGATSHELRDVVQTVEGTPRGIVNPNGEAYQPHPKKPFYFPTLEITRNEPISSPVGATQLAYCGKLNSDTFWGVPAGKWMCENITWQLASKPLPRGLVIPYLVVSYQFTAKDSHDLKYARIAPNFWTGALETDGRKKLRAFRTDDGHQSTGFIDSSGYATATLTWDEFPIFEQKPFKALNLPQSPRDAVRR